MRGFLTDLLKWTMLTAVLYGVLLIVTGSMSWAGRDRNLKYLRGSDEMLLDRLRDIDPAQRYDILVMGSSHAYRGMDPRVFAKHGWRMFNLGSSSQTPAQTAVLLEHHLHHIRPDLTVIEIFPSTFEHRGVEAALDVISNDRVDRATIRMAFGTGDITALNTLVYALFRQCLGLDGDHTGPAVRPNGDRYISGGYVQRGDTTYRPGRTAPFPDWQPLPRHLHRFEANIATLRAAGSDVVIVHTPVMPNFRRNEAGQAAVHQYFSAQGPYLDMSALFAPTDTALFYDGHHLTQRGVERFNAALIARLQADGHLKMPERRPPQTIP